MSRICFFKYSRTIPKNLLVVKIYFLCHIFIDNILSFSVIAYRHNQRDQAENFNKDRIDALRG